MRKIDFENPSEIKLGKSVWVEDGCHKSESLREAWRRLCNEEFDSARALVSEDWGDGDAFLMPNGYVAYLSYPGNSEIHSPFQEARAPELVIEQPPPKANEYPAVWGLVMEDMAARDAEGRRKYGVPLQPFNGRDALVDAYQESLDQCVYLRQLIYERDRK